MANVTVKFWQMLIMINKKSNQRNEADKDKALAAYFGVSLTKS